MALKERAGGSLKTRFALNKGDSDFSKNTRYRFLNSYRTNWIRFTSLLAKAVISYLKNLTDANRSNVFIVDDSTFERNRSKKVELLSRVYDHSKNVYAWGYRLLTLGWSDGHSFIPVNSCLLSSSKEKNRRQEAYKIDKRCSGYKQRLMAQASAPETLLKMLKIALKEGIKASYVLFDSWFSFPSLILDIKKLGLEVIAIVKKTSKVHYLYKGKRLSVTDIYKMNRKRRGRSGYLLSVEVELSRKESKESCPARLVFVRNRSNRKDYLVLISTDMTLTEDEIIRIYGKRWDIEVFFKTSKSFLWLTKGCRSISYDAMTAHTAIVFTRYMLLAFMHRLETDDRTIGVLFYSLSEEVSDITLAEAMRRLIEAFVTIAAEKLLINEIELKLLLDKFIGQLPVSIRKNLLLCA